MSLPSGYKRLEYIQSSGTQYIDTGFVPDANTRVIADFQLISPGTDNRCVFGTAGQFSFRWYGASSKFRSVGQVAVDFAAGISGAARYTVDKTATKTTLSTGQSVTTVAANSITLSLYLFAQHAVTTAGVNSQASMKIWSLQIYSGATLVRDFVPCQNASGVVGLWDDVNNVFYSNIGSGTFTAGPEIVVSMEHKTLIDGTGYAVSSGKCLVSGTGYAIKKGRTLVDGTGYDLAFEEGPEVWVLDNMQENIAGSEKRYSCNFTSNGESWALIRVEVDEEYGGVVLYYTPGTYSGTMTYRTETGWVNAAYQTLTFEEEPTGELLEWLQANGTPQ